MKTNLCSIKISCIKTLVLLSTLLFSVEMMIAKVKTIVIIPENYNHEAAISNELDLYYCSDFLAENQPFTNDPQIGDYRTIAAGNWNNVKIWEVKATDGWIAATSSPVPALNTVFTKQIFINNDITFTTNEISNFSQIIVNDKAILTKGGSQPLQIAENGKILIKSGGNLIANTSLVLHATATFEIENEASYTHNYGGTSQLTATIFAGIEKFHPKSNFIINTLPDFVGTIKTSLKVLISDFSKLSPFMVGSADGAYFGNIIFSSTDITNLVYAETSSQNASATEYAIAAGDLIYRSGTETARLVHDNSTVAANGSTVSTAAKPYRIGGSLILESNYTGTVCLRETPVDTYFKIGKNIELKNNSKFKILQGASDNSAANLNVLGNIIVEGTGSFLFINNDQNNRTANVYLAGNLEISSLATFANFSANKANLNFSGLWDGNELKQMINNGSQTNDKINFIVNSGSYAKLINYNLALGTNSRFEVKSGGVFDFGFSNEGVALNIERATTGGISSGQSFALQSGGTLKITSPNGIQDGGTYVGNVKVGSDENKRTFSSGATYHFIGKQNANNVATEGVDQISGKALPSSALSKQIIIELATTNTSKDDVSFKAKGIKKFNDGGSLIIIKGKVVDEDGNGFEDEKNQNGNLRMEGGRYKISRSGTQPSLGGTYTLNDGVVEFAGSSSETKIRINPKYMNVDISGNNVTLSGKNFVVNNLLKFTSTNTTFTVPKTADTDTPYTVTAKKGIQVTSGSIVIFDTNAQLLQDADAVNNGSLTAYRQVNIKDNNQYNYLISPMIGSNLKNNVYSDSANGSESSSPSVIYYSESTNFFYASTGAYIPGRALAVKEPTAASAGGSKIINARFYGQPMNGAFTFSLANSNTAATGFNLVGNPYPSNIDLRELYILNGGSTTNSNVKGSISSTFSFWDNTANDDTKQYGSNYSGKAYAVYNAYNDTGNAAGILLGNSPSTVLSSKIPNRFAGVGQGFIVRSITVGGVLKFDNTIRKNRNLNAAFFKKDADSVRDRYWLSLRTPSGLVNSLAVVHFEGGSESVGLDDTQLNVNTSDMFFTHVEGQKLQIDGRPTFHVRDNIQLGTKHFIAGQYTISLGKREGVFEFAHPVYLKDKSLGIITELSRGNYSFEANAGEFTDRFEIVYKPEGFLGTNSAEKEELKIYREGQNFVVKSKIEKITELELYDIAGRLLQKTKPNNTDSVINASSLINGTYFIKIEQQNNISVKKIVK